jgi:hypothetical protein
MSQNASASERRRDYRAAISLPGRYLLADEQGFDCRIIDVSPVGVAILGPLAGDLGERVVVYVQDLRRIEDVMVRRSSDGFAVDLRVSPNELHKLSARIEWLMRRQAGEAPERRGYARVGLDQERTTLQLSDGRAFEAALIEVSSNSAALEVDFAPALGAAVTVGKRRAHVTRQFAGGIAVAFDPD